MCCELCGKYSRKPHWSFPIGLQVSRKEWRTWRAEEDAVSINDRLMSAAVLFVGKLILIFTYSHCTAYFWCSSNTRGMNNPISDLKHPQKSWAALLGVCFPLHFLKVNIFRSISIMRNSRLSKVCGADLCLDYNCGLGVNVPDWAQNVNSCCE